MWLSPEIFSWEPWFSSGKSVDDSRWRRPYDLHAHAEKLVVEAASKMSIADAVLNLRRAIGMRTKHLEELYRFKSLFRDVEGVLERLEAVGLARPFLIRQLIDLRDDIEHKDLPPPSAVRCRELSDAAWYFLKSTDYAAKIVPTAVQLSASGGGPNGDGSTPFVDVQSKGPESVTYRVTGWLPLTLLSSEERPSWLPLTVDAIRDKHDFPGVDELLRKSREGDKSVSTAWVERVGMDVFRNASRSEDERYVIGDWHASLEHRRTICKLMLESL